MGARRIQERNPRNFRARSSAGVCRAGVGPKESVVNPHFESHDVENLFVCDGSVLPRVCLGTKFVPVCCVAAFAARRLIANHFTRA